MLARVTYGLVAAALGTLIGGFFVRDTNILLYVSIGLSVAAIVLVLVGAARRAREAPEGGVGEPAFADVGADEGEIPEDVLEAFDELEEEDEDEEEEPEFEFDEEAFEEEEEEPEFEEDEEEPVPARRRAATKSKAKPTARPKDKAKAKAKSKAKAAPKKKAAAPSGSAAGRVVIVPGRDRYHDAGCRFVKGKDDVEEVARGTAKRRGYEPCSVCSPD